MLLLPDLYAKRPAPRMAAVTPAPNITSGDRLRLVHHSASAIDDDDACVVAWWPERSDMMMMQKIVVVVVVSLANKRRKTRYFLKRFQRVDSASASPNALLPPRLDRLGLDFPLLLRLSPRALRMLSILLGLRWVSKAEPSLIRWVVPAVLAARRERLRSSSSLVIEVAVLKLPFC